MNWGPATQKEEWSYPDPTLSWDWHNTIGLLYASDWVWDSLRYTMAADTTTHTP